MSSASNEELYSIVLTREIDDGESGWTATVPELPGCGATAPTQIEVLTLVRESIHLWIQSQEKSGRTVPGPIVSEPSGKFTIRVPRWVHRQLKLLADVDGSSLNQYVSSVLTYWAGNRSIEQQPTAHNHYDSSESSRPLP